MAGACNTMQDNNRKRERIQCLDALWFANVVPAFDFEDFVDDLDASVFAALPTLPPWWTPMHIPP